MAGHPSPYRLAYAAVERVTELARRGANTACLRREVVAIVRGWDSLEAIEEFRNQLALATEVTAAEIRNFADGYAPAIRLGERMIACLAAARDAVGS